MRPNKLTFHNSSREKSNLVSKLFRAINSGIATGFSIIEFKPKSETITIKVLKKERHAAGLSKTNLGAISEINLAKGVNI